MTSSTSGLRAVKAGPPLVEIPRPVLAPLAWMRRVLHTFDGRRQRDAAVAVLHGLDNRTLRDIGVERSQIVSLVYGDETDQAPTDRAA